MNAYSAGARQRGLKDIGVGVGLSAVCGGLLATIGDTYTCAFTVFVEPPELTDTVTVEADDPEGNTTSASDVAVVVVTDDDDDDDDDD